MKYSFICKKETATSEVENEIQVEAEKYGFTYDEEYPDIIFVLGGDGTFLQAVQNNLDRLDEVVFIGINCGSLGFSYDFSRGDISELFYFLDAYELKEKEIPLLHGTIFKDFDEQVDFYAINEIRISSLEASIKCDITINDELLENFLGSGIAISSSFGSSGLNKSLNGALVSHDLNVIQVTPISPINNRVYNCLTNGVVLPFENTNIYLDGDFSRSKVSFDSITLDDSFNSLLVTGSDLKARVLVRKDYNFINMIRKNLLK